MSSKEIAIRVSNLSKCYQIYDNPRDRLKQFVVPTLCRAIPALRMLFTATDSSAANSQGVAKSHSPSFFKEFWALKDVSFEINRGETVGIIGRNGSGKSTLLQMICGTLNPTGGSVHTNGRIAALLELGSGFNPEFTGRENVYMNATVLGLTKEEIDARFDEIAAFADIGDFIERSVKTYSSGMMVRLAFAVSVSVNPEILVVDEALAVGDMAFQQKCFQRLADLLERGTTIILVTHDIMLIRNYCTRAIYLDHGVVKQIGDPETVGELYIHDLFSERQGARSGDAIEWRNDGGSGRIAFGTSRGRIASVRISGRHSQGHIFQQGERVLFDICGEADKDIANPEFIFQVRDARGYVLYGVSSKPSNLTINARQACNEIIAQLYLPLELAVGNYSITLALVDRHGETILSVIDKVVGVIDFSVAESEKEKFHGCINLHGVWIDNIPLVINE